jgi:hypothetical protein
MPDDSKFSLDHYGRERIWIKKNAYLNVSSRHYARHSEENHEDY